MSNVNPSARLSASGQVLRLSERAALVLETVAANCFLEPERYRLQLAAERLALIAGFDDLICLDASPFRPDELDNGYFTASNVQACEARGIQPYIATGREAPHKSWRTVFDQRPELPLEDASLKVEMAYQLQTDIG